MVPAAVMVRNAPSCATLRPADGEPTAHPTAAMRPRCVPAQHRFRPPGSMPAKLAEAVGSDRLPLLVCLKQVSADKTGIPQVRESENGQPRGAGANGQGGRGGTSVNGGAAGR